MATRKTAAKPVRPRKSPAKKQTTPNGRVPAWARRLMEVAQMADERELEALPRDLIRNFDHYADGSPRQD